MTIYTNLFTPSRSRRWQFPKRLAQLVKTELLILDDFGLKPLTQTERHDLLEVIEDRRAVCSTLITSQLPSLTGMNTSANRPSLMHCSIASCTTLTKPVSRFCAVRSILASCP
jgi:hypothetical protein